MVVQAALESSEAKEYGWKIAPRSMVLPLWERRGREDSIPKRPELAESVVCCEPGIDKTNGFFVSCFVRPSAVPAGHSAGPSPAAAVEPLAESSTPVEKKGTKRKSAPETAASVVEEAPTASAPTANTYSHATQGLDEKRKKKKRKGGAAKKSLGGKFVAAAPGGDS